MKSRIKRIIKLMIRPFQRVSYIDNYIYQGNALNGRTALITGGTSGIGFAIARSFALNGCNVVITGRNKEKIDVAVDRLKQTNKDIKVTGYVFDISDTCGIQSRFDEIVGGLEGTIIDILVNNAGVIKGDNIGNTSIEDYEICLKTNLEGTYFLSQAFYNYLKKIKNTGNILNICSSSSMRPGVKPYTISKWGLRSITVGMAKRFIKDGIVVNGIAPGPTYTPMLVENAEEKDIKLYSNPSGRYVTPEEIANGALFLVSDMGKMVVGDIIYMTGGAGVVTVDDIEY